MYVLDIALYVLSKTFLCTPTWLNTDVIISLQDSSIIIISGYVTLLDYRNMNLMCGCGRKIIASCYSYSYVYLFSIISLMVSYRYLP